MKIVSLLAVALISVSATAEVVKIADCKPLTPDLVVLPGDNANVKGTALRASSIVLSQDGLGEFGPILKADFTGTDVEGKPLQKSISAEYSTAIGSDYMSFSRSADVPHESFQSIKMEIEMIREGNEDVPKKALFSVFAIGSRKTTQGKLVNTTETTHSLCDVVQRMTK